MYILIQHKFQINNIHSYTSVYGISLYDFSFLIWHSLFNNISIALKFYAVTCIIILFDTQSILIIGISQELPLLFSLFLS